MKKRNPILAATLITLTLAVGQNLSSAWAENTMQGRVVYTQQVRTANALLQTGKYPQAEILYTEALKARPDDVAARSGLAMAQAELYKLDAAERLVQQGWTCPKQPLCPDCSRASAVND